MGFFKANFVEVVVLIPCLQKCSESSSYSFAHINTLKLACWWGVEPLPGEVWTTRWKKQSSDVTELTFKFNSIWISCDKNCDVWMWNSLDFWSETTTTTKKLGNHLCTGSLHPSSFYNFVTCHAYLFVCLPIFSRNAIQHKNCMYLEQNTSTM